MVASTAKAIAAQIARPKASCWPAAPPAALAVAQRLNGRAQGFPGGGGLRGRQRQGQPNAVFAGSVPYLMLAGNLVAGWQMGRCADGGPGPSWRMAKDAAFMRAKIATAQFYADHILARGPGLRDSIVEGGESVTALAAGSVLTASVPARAVRQGLCRVSFTIKISC